MPSPETQKPKGAVHEHDTCPARFCIDLSTLLSLARLQDERKAVFCGHMVEDYLRH